MAQLDKLDVELRTRRLAKSWGVELPDACTFTVAVLLLVEKLHAQQESVLRRLQEIHAEQTKMWIQIRSKEKRK